MVKMGKKRHVNKSTLLLNMLKNEIVAIKNSTVKLKELIENMSKCFIILKDEIVSSNVAVENIWEQFENVVKSFETFKDEIGTITSSTDKIEEHSNNISTILIFSTDSDYSSHSTEPDHGKGTNSTKCRRYPKRSMQPIISGVCKELCKSELQNGRCIITNNKVIATRVQECLSIHQVKLEVKENVDNENEEGSNSESDSLSSEMGKSNTKISYDNLMNDDKLFTCKKCDAKFTDRKLLRNHQSQHSEENLIVSSKCKECGKCFRSNSTLIVHMRIHTGEHPYKCDDCGKCFNANSNFLRHRKLHSGKRPYQCSMCDKAFADNGTCRRHERKSHTEKPAVSTTKTRVRKCRECGLEFPDIDDYRDHIGPTYTDNITFRCNECGKCFKEVCGLNNHVKTHQRRAEKLASNVLINNKPCSMEPADSELPEKKKHLCDECGKSFTERSNLSRHRKIHSGVKPFKCRVCSKSFYDSCECKRHERRHFKAPLKSRNRFRKCKVCGTGFTEYLAYMKHVGPTTTDNSMFKCEICGKCFRENCGLQCHVKMHVRFPGKSTVQPIISTSDENPDENPNSEHQPNNDLSERQKYPCEECGKHFTEKSNLYRHRKIHSGEKPYTCETCGKSFCDNDRLKKHARTHVEKVRERTYHCGECDRWFSTSCSLKEHMRIHLGHKPYQCPNCGRCFVQNSTFKNHMRIHTGEKPFECKICHKKFSLRASLIGHTKLHKGEKDYICNECGKAFLHRNKLREHMRRHTGENPYKCHICEKAFTTNGTLTRHLKKVCTIAKTTARRSFKSRTISYENPVTVENPEISIPSSQSFTLENTRPLLGVTEKHTLLLENRMLSFEKQTLALENSMMPLEKQGLPLEDRMVPFEKPMLPVNNKVGMAEKDIQPLENRMIPLEMQTLPFENKAGTLAGRSNSYGHFESPAMLYTWYDRSHDKL